MNKIDLRRIDLNLLTLFEVLMSERSVSRAADRLARTQSAVSHSLARLREQLDDPLLVKRGGQMVPSPYALRLAEEVGPILRGIERVLAPGEAFDPKRSTRVFRIAAPDFALTLFPNLLQRARSAAPRVAIDWAAPGEAMLLAVADGSIDLAILPAGIRLPEAVSAAPVGDLQWRCFARRGHPALKSWGRKSWARWPHVAVRIGDRLRSPVDAASAAAGIKRSIAAWVPNFGAVAPLLAGSDLLATLPAIALGEAREPFGLVAKRVPIPIEPLPHVIAWSTRQARDPAIEWMRTLAVDVMGEFVRRAESM
jgi:DNA-binding transcriptional LysR family regulator